MRVLISGFEPFGGRTTNPTAQLLDSFIEGQIKVPKEMNVTTMLLPVSFENSFQSLSQKIEEFNPDVILCFGQNAKAEGIYLEEVAANEIKTENPDNTGLLPADSKINPQGPETYLSTLPLQGFLGALQDAKISAKLSQDAGRYVCNYLFYKLMENNQTSLRLCGFIHVPLEEVLSISELSRALTVMLKYLKY